MIFNKLTRFIPSITPKHLHFSTKSALNSTKINLNGQTINYVQTGSGPRKVLCFPGALGTIWSDFKPQVEKLDKNLFTIIAFDPAGYGDSRPPIRKFTPDFYHTDAKIATDFMKFIGFDKFSVLGWSDGGICGMIMAAKYPESIEKLVIWGSNSYVVKEEIEQYEKIRDISKWSGKMKAPLIEMYTEKGFQDMWNGWCDALQEIYKSRNGNICKELVDKIQCPVLVLHGDKDPMCDAAHSVYFEKHMKNVELIRFPEGKHNIHLRYADEFNTKVTQFLTK